MHVGLHQFSAARETPELLYLHHACVSCLMCVMSHVCHVSCVSCLMCVWSMQTRLSSPACIFGVWCIFHLWCMHQRRLSSPASVFHLWCIFGLWCLMHISSLFHLWGLMHPWSLKHRWSDRQDKSLAWPCVWCLPLLSLCLMRDIALVGQGLGWWYFNTFRVWWSLTPFVCGDT